jgi:hypothetical protein
MPQQQNYRKRRPKNTPDKNELKVSRNEAEKRSHESAGTLRERFPQVRAMRIEMRMEATTGAILEDSKRSIGLDESLWVDVPCLGGCSNGVFLLTEAIDAVLTSGQESREGMGLCQSGSFRDPSLPCSTKFYYRVVVDR